MKTAIISFISMAITHSVYAETIRPDIGVPLRDAAVCRGPSGAYYLTGTTADPRSSIHTHADFHHCRGVRVWKSNDLKSWEDIGLAWDLRVDRLFETEIGSNAYQMELMPVAGYPAGKRARGMTAPRLAHDGERFWITYSMNGYGVGAMPGGREVLDAYTNNGILEEMGGAPTGQSDASLFVDSDGTSYLVWGGGCIAKLKAPEDLAKMFEAIHGYGRKPEAAYAFKGIEGPTHYLPTLTESFTGDDGLPDRDAPYGPFVFRADGKYHFVFTATTLRDAASPSDDGLRSASGGIHEDSYICHAENLLGPYSKPEFLILGSGRVTAFPGRDGQMHLAYSDAGNRPVITTFPTPPVGKVVSGAPKPVRGEIARSVPAPLPVDHPEDIPQLIDYVKPVIDQPLRDAALCFGPDPASPDGLRRASGTWYMIGTEASWKAEDRGQKAEVQSKTELDWANNKGIRLWKSEDRENWEDMGYVWDIERDAPKSPSSSWQLDTHLDLTCGAWPQIGRAITAPEMHYLKDTFWIVYSMNGSGIGLMKSKTGKAEGPYEDLGKMVAHARDGSLFEDADGTVYLVWGQGFYAKLSDDLTRVVSPAKALFTNHRFYFRNHRVMEHMGQWGSQLHGLDDAQGRGKRYVWTFTSRTGRHGVNTIDTLLSWAPSLDEPFCHPVLLVAHGGQSTLVQDPDKGWLATVSSEDEYSQAPYQACITEIVSSAPGFRDLPWAPGDPLDLAAKSLADPWFFRSANAYRETMLDLWKGWPDLLHGTPFRDVDVMWDGKQYLATGTMWGWDRRRSSLTSIWHSDDLLHWAEWPGVYDWRNLEKEGPVHPLHLPAYKERIEKDQLNLAEPKIFMAEGKYHLILDDSGTWRPYSVWIVQSETNDPRGPYKALCPMPYGCVTVDEDGAFYVSNFGFRQTRGRPAIARYESLRDFLNSPKDDDAHAKKSYPFETPSLPNITLRQDCEVGLEPVAGKWVWWSVDWTGSYDMNYLYADTPAGPWHGNLRVLPDGGNGKLFRDKNGGYWYTGHRNLNSFSAHEQTRDRFNYYPLEVRMEDGELILEPKALVANRERINQMGALWYRP